uniref:Uncharacterized protein n=1 Tax=Riboviria sp. TaxID=2585031 RepID=A0A8K1U3W2_9VIRU|nr:MAG: hypothetical protein 2 [Riboviria sp.]
MANLIFTNSTHQDGGSLARSTQKPCHALTNHFCTLQSHMVLSRDIQSLPAKRAWKNLKPPFKGVHPTIHGVFPTVSSALATMGPKRIRSIIVSTTETPLMRRYLSSSSFLVLWASCLTKTLIVSATNCLFLSCVHLLLTNSLKKKTLSSSYLIPSWPKASPIVDPKRVKAQFPTELLLSKSFNARSNQKSKCCHSSFFTSNRQAA